MKKFIAILFMAGLCLSAAAQKLDSIDTGSPIDAQISFTYGYNINPAAGMNHSGWGFEVSSIYLGRNPWKNGYLTVGLLDFSVDYSYLQHGWGFIPTVDRTDIVTGQGIEAGENTLTNCSSANFAFTFPLGYIHQFGDKVKAGAFVAPGVGWTTYNNKFTTEKLEWNENYSVRKDAYFRLNLQAYVWFDDMGVVVRYAFPKAFKGAGIASVGVSLVL